jgi:ABC-type dipeptide/oligopeptide/nickel transport system permease subunit
MVAIVVIVAIFAPLIAPFNPEHQDLFNTDSAPSATHWFGTDIVGRDQLSRVIYGSRIALEVGLASIFLSVLIGVVLGAIAGYFGRFWDSLIMRICDIFFAFPILVGAVVIITVVGQGVTPVILALAIFGWSTIARLLRGSILSVREAEYVEAARSLGASRWRIVTRHILPNSFAPVLIFAAFSVGNAIIAEASLSYLGVGVKPDVAEWGNMIAAGQANFQSQPWLSLLPGSAVVFTVLAFVFIGDGLRDALDPKLR